MHEVSPQDVEEWLAVGAHSVIWQWGCSGRSQWGVVAVGLAVGAGSGNSHWDQSSPPCLLDRHTCAGLGGQQAALARLPHIRDRGHLLYRHYRQLCDPRWREQLAAGWTPRLPLPTPHHTLRSTMARVAFHSSRGCCASHVPPKSPEFGNTESADIFAV